MTKMKKDKPVAELNDTIIDKLKKSCITEISNVKKSEDLEKVKLKYFSRKGKIRELFQKLPSLSIEKRKMFGEKLNRLSNELNSVLEKKIVEIQSINKTIEPAKSQLLLSSLPGVSLPYGNLHPLQKVFNEIIQIFTSLGFSVELGPEIESEDYNFTKLNFPEYHPARDMQDTFYVSLPKSDKGNFLLRTHTSPVQIRLMLSQKPPIKAIMPGRVYRHDNLDVSHQFNFHQVEGLVVDKSIKLSDLKGTLNYFVKSMFGKNVNARFRQSYFPFTEPSLEVDIQCLTCGGKGCSVCKNSGYLEIIGCGMVHPEVLNNVGYGYEEYTGFAFGLGVERVAMLRYRINDIRLFYENDLRFLKQF